MKLQYLNALRTRWAAVGAAVAITLGAGGVGVTQAVTSSGERPVYLPIEPCRLADLRPAPDRVGPRSSPLGPDETYTLSGWGTVGECTLPADTAGLALNVTALGATQPTFLAVFPADATDVPNASNLNPVPGQPPTPNAVSVDLDATGEFSIYNLQGAVNVIVDVVGVYDDHHHDDRYYTKAQVDADRTRTLSFSPFDMQWVGAPGTSTFNGCPTRPTGGGVGRLGLDAIPAGATVVSGTAYVFDSTSASAPTVSWYGSFVDGAMLTDRLLGSATVGDTTFSLDTVPFVVDPPFVVAPGSSMWLAFSSNADDNGFCGFEVTYVLPDM